MSKNDNLISAKLRRNDEFYTRRCDIEAELSHYPGAFAGKKVYLPCDEAGASEFWNYFADNFDALGLSSLVATCWNEGGRGRHSEIVSGGGPHNLAYASRLLAGDGDFLSQECLDILADCDVVVTNLPFSRFRAYIKAMMECNRDFLVVGGKNGGKYQEIIEYVVAGKMRLGVNESKGTMRFETPEGALAAVASYWFTTFEPDVPKPPLDLTEAYEEGKYEKYANFDAIEVPRLSLIPADYAGLMGVPITFLEHYDPGIWELMGTNATVLEDAPQDMHIKANADIYRRHNFYIEQPDGRYRRIYDRLVIRRKSDA